MLLPHSVFCGSSGSLLIVIAVEEAQAGYSCHVSSASALLSLFGRPHRVCQLSISDSLCTQTPHPFFLTLSDSFLDCLKDYLHLRSSH